jgi:two-component system, cell cycle sensor histidine kinase and response regulator CckA
MAKLSGRELAERLAALRPGLRVLFMSGETEDPIVHQGAMPALSSPVRLWW